MLVKSKFIHNYFIKKPKTYQQSIHRQICQKILKKVVFVDKKLDIRVWWSI
ncbi:hypothetical protein HMPREF3189_00658 [Clostridiales bacterium KA00134]|nr:hypothetical protein HMPREF3189_00658 [Clostridiales bacterium KA00134]